MTRDINGLNAEMLRLRQLQQTKAVKPAAVSKTAAKTSAAAFADVLKEKMSAPDIKFSAHAVGRLIDRDITLTKPQLDRLRDAVGKAAEKGAKESLVLMEDMAFVVSIKNSTVITAMTGQSIKENVFTNIDSAVII